MSHSTVISTELYKTLTPFKQSPCCIHYVAQSLFTQTHSKSARRCTMRVLFRFHADGSESEGKLQIRSMSQLLLNHPRRLRERTNILWNGIISELPSLVSSMHEPREEHCEDAGEQPFGLVSSVPSHSGWLHPGAVPLCQCISSLI